MKILNKQQYIEEIYFGKQKYLAPDGSIYNMYVHNRIKTFLRKNISKMLTKYKPLFINSHFPTFTKIK